ncbi:MAG TPA: DNA polymerase, partial [Gemmataceae bacterium]|nr:DNA polymerase [Gemmataceae bacterium]
MFSASQEVRCRKFQKYQAAMLLQVHDELVFEAPAEETQRLAAMVKREMEEVYPLEVPLVA